MSVSLGQIKTITSKINKATEICNSAKKQIQRTIANSSDCQTSRVFELPRFGSIEMQQARTMNKIAIHQAKSKINRSYPKASSKDLKRLTSQTIEDTYSRVEWTNPKDGKVYNLLKQRETENGDIVVRILDADGAFIKEATIKPKTIVIMDNFQEKTRFLDLSHGDLVSTYAKRNNPFAKYILLQKDAEHIYSVQDLAKLQRIFKEQGKPDFISCSFGLNTNAKRKYNLTTEQRNTLDKTITLYDDIADKQTRVLFSAQNAKPENLKSAKEIANHVLATNSKVEGVGSLSNTNGKISDFSCSRNSSLTQHYEVGEYVARPTQYGVNITGLPGTDLSPAIKTIEKAQNNPLVGKSIAEVEDKISQINKAIKDLEEKTMSLFKVKRPISEILQEKSQIEKQLIQYQQEKNTLYNQVTQLYKIDGRLEMLPEKITGTSFSTPIRTAKLALNDMMEGIL